MAFVEIFSNSLPYLIFLHRKRPGLLQDAKPIATPPIAASSKVDGSGTNVKPNMSTSTEVPGGPAGISILRSTF